jgi:hypothetical protein
MRKNSKFDILQIIINSEQLQTFIAESSMSIFLNEINFKLLIFIFEKKSEEFTGGHHK